jgi:hypothetical protein
VFFLAGVSLAAQDMIILKDGNVIEAKVTEISPTEIRYKRFDRLDGPTIVIPAADVLSIRYEDGMVEVINDAPAAGQEGKPGKEPKRSTMDPDKFYFAFNGNPGGALVEGTSFCIELGKGKFNTEINLIFPSLGGLAHKTDKGFGVLVTFNRFWHSRIGGFYLGGGGGFVYQQRYVKVTDDVWYTEGTFDEFIFSFGANLGYKFVIPAGLYFRVGGYAGMAFGYADSPVNFYFKPDLAVGWSF